MKRHIPRKTETIALIMAFILLISGCFLLLNFKKPKYNKYTYEFYDSFNTVIQFMGYAKNEKQFDELAHIGQARFEELHKLYDIYNDYDGINNIKTINDNAGIHPVEVSKDIIDLLTFSKEWYNKTNGTMNVALGPVLSIWHTYREEGKNDPDAAKVPDIDMLRKASLKTDISKVDIDTAKKTVFLQESGMSLDVGAVAKGFSTEVVVKELAKAGFTSFIVNSGGNVRVYGKPLDPSRTKWGIGIHNPDENSLIPDTPSLDTIYANDTSLVSSGDYERYYVVNGKRYHHLIDPVTFMPADYYRAVTIMTQDSGMADALSTAVFLLPYEKSRALVESLDGVDALWIMPDGSLRATDNMKRSLKDMGGASNK